MLIPGTRLFLLRTAAIAVAGICLRLFETVFLEDPSEYLVPSIWLVGGIYLGWMDRAATGWKSESAIKKACGSGFVAIGLWLAMPPAVEAEMVWRHYSDQAVAEARRDGRPVIIDFFASWCEPCLRLDRRVFGNREVVAATARFVMLRADVTDQASVSSRRVIGLYHVEGYPTVVFLGTNGLECVEQRVLGYVSAADLKRRLDVCH